MSQGNGNIGLRGLPSVDKVLAEPALAALLSQYRREFLVQAVRDHLSGVRSLLAAGSPAPSAAVVAEAV
ncbi:MAG: hypothetical protein WD645_04120, partial [Dehalococcoidia bacterium]